MNKFYSLNHIIICCIHFSNIILFILKLYLVLHTVITRCVCMGACMFKQEIILTKQCYLDFVINFCLLHDNKKDNNGLSTFYVLSMSVIKLFPLDFQTRKNATSNWFWNEEAGSFNPNIHWSLQVSRNISEIYTKVIRVGKGKRYWP